MSYVYMKSLENKAEKYDKGIKILTFGKLPKIKQYIADRYIDENDKLLDIGMGTGTFTLLCAKKGANITGIDYSEKMLEVAKKNIKKEQLNKVINVIKMPVVDLDKIFSKASFDKITAILSFSEFYLEEQEYVLDQIFQILKDDGRLIIVDEVKPKKKLKKLLYYIIRLPLALVNFIKTHISTKPLLNFEERLKKHHFQIVKEDLYLFDTLKLMCIKKNNIKGE